MQITDFTDYGLRCLMYLAVRQNRLSTVKEIAEYYGISRNHLVKVVHKLSQLKLIESCKGKGGGIKLACNAENLKLGEVIAMLETNMALVECHQINGKCKIMDICLLRHFLYEAGQAFIDVLNKYSLADASKSLKINVLE